MPRILVLHNEPTLPPDHPDAESEHDILFTADVVTKALQQAGLTVARLGLVDDLAPLLPGLKAFRPDAVFNLYEGTAKWGNTEAFVAGVLECARVPFTGSPTQPIQLCRSKPLTKHLLAGAGLPTAKFFAADAVPCPPNPLGWPVIVKPGTEDASVGIDQGSVVKTQKQLDARADYLLRTYGGPVLVEQFIRGREFNVALVERGGELTVLPFSEIVFLDAEDSPHWPIVSFDAKWKPGTRDFLATPAKNPCEVAPELEAAVAGAAKKAFRLVGCRDYARVDFRVNAAGEPFILEVNPNPCISPLAGLAAALETAKIPYPDFLLGLVRNALRRGPNPDLADALGQPAAAPAEAALARPPRSIRPARPADREPLAGLIHAADGYPAADRDRLADAVGGFTRRGRPDDAACLVLARGVARDGAVVVRRADPANGAFALDLLVVAPELQGRGFGADLLRAAEQFAGSMGGRVLLADVSSGAGAARGRRFLVANGFRAVADLTDYYPDGTSRLTYAKTVPAPAAAAGKVPSSRFQVPS